MMTKSTKTCKQCGEIKPLEQFRKYYGGRTGRYTTCKLCERLNSREKYLSSKESLSAQEADELAKIHLLWSHQRALGLKPPRTFLGSSVSVAESLDSMVERYAVRAKAVIETAPSTAKPAAELADWLVRKLDKQPEYYQDEVYPRLRDKYMPQLRIDQDTMLPVYDTTYKATLDEIAKRFDEYEDDYYG